MTREKQINDAVKTSITETLMSTPNYEFSPRATDMLECAFTKGAEWADAHPKNPWHKASEELPPCDTEVVCKMKGVPFTEHFICKWDGKYWWHWCYIQGVTGWFGLNEDWEVVEWKEI